MPLYEYQCDACGQRFEVIQKYSETADVCRRCGKGPVHRLLSSPAIQFKGSGFYITDYAQKGKSSDGAGGSSDSKSGNTDSKAGSTDSKPAASTGSTDTSAKTESKGETKRESSTPATTPAKSDS
jgi:putative FmdB family regulatory protein